MDSTLAMVDSLCPESKFIAINITTCTLTLSEVCSVPQDRRANCQWRGSMH